MATPWLTCTISTESIFLMVIQTGQKKKLVLYLCLGEVGDTSKCQEIIHGSFRTSQRNQGDEMKASGFWETRGLSNKYCCLLQLEENGIILVIPLGFLGSLSCAEWRHHCLFPPPSNFSLPLPYSNSATNCFSSKSIYFPPSQVL